jgi:hypothetical protein
MRRNQVVIVGDARGRAVHVSPHLCYHSSSVTAKLEFFFIARRLDTFGCVGEGSALREHGSKYEGVRC